MKIKRFNENNTNDINWLFSKNIFFIRKIQKKYNVDIWLLPAGETGKIMHIMFNDIVDENGNNIDISINESNAIQMLENMDKLIEVIESTINQYPDQDENDDEY